jgi:hypothetical protein
MNDMGSNPKKTGDVSIGEITHHGVCRGCPEEWLGNAQKVHREAEIHNLAHGHRTVVAEVDP